MQLHELQTYKQTTPNYAQDHMTYKIQTNTRANKVSHQSPTFSIQAIAQQPQRDGCGAVGESFAWQLLHSHSK